MRFVMSRAGLFEADGFALAFWADDDGLQAEEVAKLTLVVQRLNADVPFALVHRNLGREVSVLDAAQAPLGGLRPELAILVPIKPSFCPARFGIRRESNRATEPILPMRENGIALVGDEGH